MSISLPNTKEMALAIAENSVQGIVVMDEAGHCLYANRAWTEVTGFTAEDMQSKPVHDWVHHHHPDGRPFPIDECPIGCTLGQNEAVRNHRDMFFKKDGTPFHVSCAASPIATDGLPMLKILEIRDITEEVKIEARKDEFLAMLAHELRNPLAPIAASAELLKLGHLDLAGMKQASAVISRQVEHMTRLINDLLDVARVTRGLIELERRVLDMNTVVAQAIEQVKPILEARCHKLTVHTEMVPAKVFGDKIRLVQIFVNILSNAAKYTPDHGEINVSVEVQPDTVQVSIADNGMGMTTEMTAHAFDLFVQAHRTPDRAQGGLGIGLSLVRSLVLLHGGSVTAHSEGLGKGAVLRVFLPNHAQHHHEDGESGRTRIPPAAVRSLKVMVVDDNRDAAEMLGMLITASGHEVRVEYDPYRALAAAEKERHDVFLLDVGLPGMDGMELARRIRKQAEHVQTLLVAITGYGQAQDRDKAFLAGFDHHVVKPVSIEHINGLLANVPAR